MIEKLQNLNNIDLLIELKLNGSLDSFSKLSKYTQIEENELRLLKKSIEDIVLEKYSISKDEYKVFKDKYLKKDSPYHIQSIKSRCTKQRENEFGSIFNFYKWFISEPKKCCYCGIDESSLKKYFEKNQNSKRFQRGKSLEIERILTDEGYNKYSKENCSFACYICNNAKSDLIYYKDFEPIAKGINKFWATKLDKDIKFPYEFYKKDIKNVITR